MKYKKYYFATGNKQKLQRLKEIFSVIDSSIDIEEVPDLVDVEENRETAELNAVQKIMPIIMRIVPNNWIRLKFSANMNIPPTIGINMKKLWLAGTTSTALPFVNAYCVIINSKAPPIIKHKKKMLSINN